MDNQRDQPRLSIMSRTNKLEFGSRLTKSESARDRAIVWLKTSIFIELMLRRHHIRDDPQNDAKVYGCEPHVARRQAGTAVNESDQLLSNIIEQLVYWTGVVLKLACDARAP